jgi:2-isopropylmalate synthase
LVLGKHSGRHALGARLSTLGYALDAEALDRAFARFKLLADKRKHVTDADLETLMTADLPDDAPGYTLESLEVRCGTGGLPNAMVCLRGPDGKPHFEEATGTGPVDAAYRAVDRIMGVPSALLEYHVQAVTEGIDAQGQVSVRIRPETESTEVHPQRGGISRTFNGHGADTDIIVASVKAYVHAKNALYAARPRTAVSAEEPRNDTHAV